MRAQLSRSEYLDDPFYWMGAPVQGGIEPSESRVLSAAHYGFTGGLIAKAFVEVNHEPRQVLDIGSGSGRWLDWYTENFRASVHGVEFVDELAANLRARGYDVAHADVHDFLSRDTRTYDTINAIGVMHHILPDAKAVEVLRFCMERLAPGGVMVVGSFFRRFPVQYVDEFGIYKRCWSLGRWKSVMQGYDLRLYHNPVCRWRGLPQNNILRIHKPL